MSPKYDPSQSYPRGDSTFKYLELKKTACGSSKCAGSTPNATTTMRLLVEHTTVSSVGH